MKPIFVEGRKGDIVQSLADITKLKTELGFVPSHEVGHSLNQLFSPLGQASV